MEHPHLTLSTAPRPCLSPANSKTATVDRSPSDCCYRPTSCWDSHGTDNKTRRGQHATLPRSRAWRRRHQRHLSPKAFHLSDAFEIVQSVPRSLPYLRWLDAMHASSGALTRSNCTYVHVCDIALRKIVCICSSSKRKRSTQGKIVYTDDESTCIIDGCLSWMAWSEV